MGALVSVPTVRGAYDAIERMLAPRLEALVRTQQYAQVTAVLAGARSSAGAQAGSVAACLLHVCNLPAARTLAGWVGSSASWTARCASSASSWPPTPRTGRRSRRMLTLDVQRSAVDRVRSEVERTALRARNGIMLATGTGGPAWA
jgi:hypothetical protein